MRYLWLAPLVLLTLACPACELLGGDDGGDLAGQWRVEAVHVQRSTQTLPLDERYIFHFQDDGVVSTQSSGCNSCSGTYRVGRTGSVEVRVACTEAACDRLPTFGSMLNEASAYYLAGDRLDVTVDDGSLGKSLTLRRVSAR